MPAEKNININIDGDFEGNIIIGDNNVVTTPDGIKVNKTKTKSKFERRTTPINLRPRAFADLLGRENEIQILQNAISKNTPVTLFGENGIGKTSLLRQAAYLTENKQFKDGVIYLTARGEERDDLLQQLFDSIYVSTPNHKPTEAQIRNDLKNIHALIILDDLTLKREDAATLLDAMPKSIFIFASDERALWGEGQVIGLDGLLENEALQLFERELGRKLKEDEKSIATQICKILLFHPLRILQTASLIREDGLSIQQAFNSLTKTRTQSAPLEATLEKSSETQKKILSLLAVAGGFVLTREHLEKLAGSANFDNEMKSLLGRGLVEAQGASFSLSGEAVSSLTRLWDLSGWEDALLNHFSSWLQTGPKDMLVDQVANTLFHLIQRAGEKKQWTNVVIIGRRLEQFYALKNKWGGWLKILKLIQLAAQYLKDQYLQGWAFHQLGSRALALDLKSEASELLNQALKIRKAIGDKGGLEVTQHNLNVLMSAPLAKEVSKPKTNSLPRMLLMGGAASVVIVLFLLMAAGAIYFITPSPTEISPPTNIPPDVISPTFTATETVVSTTSPTPTRRVTSTPVLREIVLFDFVKSAPDAVWFIKPDDSISDSEFITPLEFQMDTGEVSPEEYGAFYGAYVGLFKAPVLEDQSKDSLALLNYPHFINSHLSGTYDLRQITLQAGDRFKARVGHVFATGEFPTSPFSVRFVVKFYEVDPALFPKSFVLIAEQEDFYDGQTHEMNFLVTSKLAGKNGWFVLEVYSLDDSFSDWAVWIDAQLIGLPR